MSKTKTRNIFSVIPANAGIYSAGRIQAGWILACARMTRTSVCLLLMATLLAGCGFHLRGSVQLPESVSVLYVQDETGSQLAPVLKQQLSSNNVAVVNKVTQARAVLIVHGEQHNKRVLSVGGTGKVQEFVLQYAVQFSLVEREGKTLLEQQSVSLERDLRFDETAVLAKSSEEAQRKQDMVQDAARQILRRIQSVGKTG